MVELIGAYGPFLWSALVAVVLVLAIWIVALQARLNRMVSHYNRLFSGSTFGTFEEAMDRYVGRLEETVSQVDALNQLCRSVEADLSGTIQRVGIVRFNPFGDVGSDQSFAVALLDSHGNGIILSSLFSRASTRVFAKAIVDGNSSHPLT
ncbi:MAG TPA: DUF4446 family protein, partial [Chloroflexota bacterium]|nr:DUF4446 family protein [Chloroflexota bacterium]